MSRFRLEPLRLRLNENDIESAVLDVLRLRRFYPLRQQSGLFRTPGEQARFIRIGEPGLPDYAVPRFFVEVKAPGRKVSEVQREKILALEEHWGLKTAVVASVEELIAWLDRHADL